MSPAAATTKIAASASRTGRDSFAMGSPGAQRAGRCARISFRSASSSTTRRFP